MQKRVYLRVEDLVDVEFVSEAVGVTTIIRTKTRDISGGGLKVYINHKVHVGEKMRLKMTLPYDRQVIQAEAEVVSADLIGVVGDAGQENLYETRFKFAKIEAEQKKFLIRYVYEVDKKKNT